MSENGHSALDHPLHQPVYSRAFGLFGFTRSSSKILLGAVELAGLDGLGQAIQMLRLCKTKPSAKAAMEGT